MKYFALAFLFICCSQPNNQSNEKQQNQIDVNFGAQLLKDGFLEFADSLKIDTLKSDLVDSFDIYNEANNKIAHIDAEELAEFNFDFFLPRLNEILIKREFNLSVQKAIDFESTNNISVNGVRVNLYSKEELEKEDFWELASKRFFREVNEQLSRQQITESFYLLFNGNDLHVLLLTTSQYKVIAEKYKNTIKEIPYLP